MGLLCAGGPVAGVLSYRRNLPLTERSARTPIFGARLSGSTFFGLNALVRGLLAYVTDLPGLLFTVWHADGTDTGDALSAWHGDWSVFYWAWWIAFAPFVGVFLASISRGRSIREYVLGAIIVPSLMYFVWLTLVGGTAIDKTLYADVGDAISGAGQGAALPRERTVRIVRGRPTSMRRGCAVSGCPCLAPKPGCNMSMRGALPAEARPRSLAAGPTVAPGMARRPAWGRRLVG